MSYDASDLARHRNCTKATCWCKGAPKSEPTNSVALRQARFVIRPAGLPGQGDLLLGAMFVMQNKQLLRPGIVYEIREILDELVIVPLGPAAIKGADTTKYRRNMAA
jgi:hypothetical protein